MFSIGDKISHPMHGAGVIADVVERLVDNKMQPFYMTSMICGSMTVLIPCNTCESIGVRYIISKDEAEELLKAIPDIIFFSSISIYLFHLLKMDYILICG